MMSLTDGSSCTICLLKKCEPGQFIILRVGEDGERIPLTIADFDREKETITIIYQIVGYSN